MKVTQLILTALLACLISTTAMTGCGKFQQDPVGGGSDTPLSPADGGPGPAKPGDEQVIRPNLALAYDFMIDVEKKITLDGLVLTEKEYILTADVSNLEEFPGATYDPNTKVFTWTPKADFFGSDLIKKMELKVHFVAKPANGKGVVYVRDWVSLTESVRQPYRPEFKAWSTLPAFVKEGTTADVWFEITDADAGKSADTFPQLVLNNPSKGNEIQPYIDIYGMTQTSATTFKYLVTLDLTNVELTNSIKDFDVTFSPKSRYGQIGGGKTWTISVFTSIRKPVSTWKTEVPFKAGVAQNWAFTVSDPRDEGSLEEVSQTGLPADAALTCVKSDDKHTLLCNMVWTPAADQVDANFTAKLKVKSSFYKNASAKDERTDEFSLQMKVVQ